MSPGDKIALAGVFVALLTTIAGGIFSYLQLEATKDSLDILANKEGVNLKPNIEIDAQMYKSDQLGSPKISIFNTGKVPATNVVVQIIRRQFDGKDFVGATWGSGNGGQYVFNEIKTYEAQDMELPIEYVVDPMYNVIELRVFYMREYDKQNYSVRTFYFYGPKGWDFGTWYNIKQAKRLDGNPFGQLIEMSLALPAALESDPGNILGSELYSF